MPHQLLFGPHHLLVDHKHEFKSSVIIKRTINKVFFSVIISRQCQDSPSLILRYFENLRNPWKLMIYLESQCASSPGESYHWRAVAFTTLKWRKNKQTTKTKQVKQVHPNEKEFKRQIFLVNYSMKVSVKVRTLSVSRLIQAFPKILLNHIHSQHIVALC